MNRLQCSLGLACVLARSLVAVGADWPQYRGPLHDGSSSESLRTDWQQAPPKVVWRKALDPAWSSVTVSGGQVFTQVNRRLGGAAREVCVALSAETGAELWATDLDAAFYPDAGTRGIDGPRSTPSVDGDRVIVLTSYLKLFCLRSDTGEVLWRRDFLSEYPGTEVIDWQNAASPLVVGDRIYLNSNVAGRCLTAVRRSDGTTVWSGQTDRMTHATPVFATLSGIPQIVFLTGRGLVGVVPETGVVLWRYEFVPSATSTAATPVVAGDYVYASCAYALGAWTARVTRSGETFRVGATDFKRSSSYQNHWSTPVHHEGFLYSVVERSFRSLACFDLEGRTNRWITSTVGSGNPGYASVIKVGGHVLVLREDGELVLLRPDAGEYSELARFQALNTVCWNHPAYSRGRLYARGNSEMVVLDLSAGPAPLPELRLSAEWRVASERLRFRVVAVDGGSLSAADVGRVELMQALPPGANGVEWSPMTLGLEARDGGWEGEIPPPTGSRYFRLRLRDQP